MRGELDCARPRTRLQLQQLTAKALWQEILGCSVSAGRENTLISKFKLVSTEGEQMAVASLYFRFEGLKVWTRDPYGVLESDAAAAREGDWCCWCCAPAEVEYEDAAWLAYKKALEEAKADQARSPRSRAPRGGCAGKRDRQAQPGLLCLSPAPSPALLPECDLPHEVLVQLAAGAERPSAGATPDNAGEASVVLRAGVHGPE